jgi:DNA-directed RNA polymerase subunit M/transcription elongation factor TFIIS
MDSAPSMVQRNGDTLIVRRVVSGDQVVLDQKDQSALQSDLGLDLSVREGREDNKNSDNQSFPQYPLPLALPPEFLTALTLQAANNFKQQFQGRAVEERNDYEQDQSGDKSDSESNLPQCKIKRNYSCNNCSFFTQNPRKFLVHLRDKHGEKIVINECKHCLYASRHYQKLVRHMKMVHGSTEGINEPGHFRRREKRRRMSAEARHKNPMPVYQATSSKNNVADLSALNQMFQFQNQLQLLQQAQMLQQQQQQQQIQESQSQDVTSDEEMDVAVTLSPNGTKIFKCTVCEFSSVEESQLIQHEKDEHSDVTFYRCEKCSYVTHIKARFSKHVKYHSMPMIKCMLCDFRTPVSCLLVFKIYDRERKIVVEERRLL